jgi:hypothetical protein
MHTKRSSVECIVRFVRFHGMRSRQDLFPAEPKIEAFLTDLALHAQVAAATQNQAMNALVFLYKRIFHHSLPGKINAVRADQKINVPMVMTRDEVAAVLSRMDGTAHLVAKFLYGAACASWKPPAQGQGHRCADDAIDRPFGQGRQGPVHHLSRHAHPRCSSTTCPGSRRGLSRI